MEENMNSRILFWNIWGHRHVDALHQYIASRSADIDICCFTEATSVKHVYGQPQYVYTSTDPMEPPSCVNGLELLRRAFEDQYDIFYATGTWHTWTCLHTKVNYPHVGFGSALMIKKHIHIIAQGDIPILESGVNHKGRVLQYVVYEARGTSYLVAHLHGVWLQHNTKGDDPVRDEQSKLVRENLERIAKIHKATKTIFGGDLNLDINTKALETLEHGGMPTFTNLIREYGIENTRTPAYRKYGHPDASRYADYVLVSPEVKVCEFSVDNNAAASDHAPLRVEFN